MGKNWGRKWARDVIARKGRWRRKARAASASRKKARLGRKMVVKRLLAVLAALIAFVVVAAVMG